MKRHASTTELDYQSPPQCGFNQPHEPQPDDGNPPRSDGIVGGGGGGEEEDVGFDLEGCAEVLLPTDDERIRGLQVESDQDHDFKRRQLENLHRELESYPAKTDILNKIKSCTPASPLEDEDLMVKFLRAEQYDAKPAARRIIKHYEKKFELFGPEKLGKQITLEDLDHDDLECLTAGGFQPIGVDANGRAVIYERFQNWRYNTASNLLRTIWYVSMSSVEENDQAKRGLVIVSFQTGPFSPDLFHRVNYKQSITILNKLLPAKLVGYHFCFDDVRFRMVWGLATIYIGKEAKQRAHDHEGTVVECMDELLSYGIDTNALPTTLDGKENNASFFRWIEERKTKEAHYD